MVFSPYEKPDNDPYELNEDGVDIGMTVFSSVPLMGLIAIGGTLLFLATNEGNEFNIANQAWNTAVIGMSAQAVYSLIVILVYYI